MMFDKTLPTKNKSAWRNSCQFIILHHTGGWSYEGNVRVLSWQTDRQVSCHYVVWLDGKVTKIGNDTDILRHAGESSRWTLKMMNSYAIGIEVVNDGEKFTDAQRSTVRTIVLELIKTHKIPVTNILRHKDISPKRKVDIYDSFWDWKYKSFADYQNSYKDTITQVDRWIIQNCLAGNSAMWNLTTNPEIRWLLEDTNNKIRSFYPL